LYSADIRCSSRCSDLVGWWDEPSRTKKITCSSELGQKKNVLQCAGNGFLPENVGCQNIASQIQGDENAVSLAAEQAFP